MSSVCGAVRESEFESQSHQVTCLRVLEQDPDTCSGADTGPAAAQTTSIHHYYSYTFSSTELKISEPDGFSDLSDLVELPVL